MLQPCDTEYPVFVHREAVREANGIIDCGTCQKYEPLRSPCPPPARASEPTGGGARGRFLGKDHSPTGGGGWFSEGVHSGAPKGTPTPIPAASGPSGWSPSCLGTGQLAAAWRRGRSRWGHRQCLDSQGGAEETQAHSPWSPHCAGKPESRRKLRGGWGRRRGLDLPGRGPS